jgi:hypothetical protein
MKKRNKQMPTWRYWLGVAIGLGIAAVLYSFNHNVQMVVGAGVGVLSAFLFAKFGKSELLNFRPVIDERYQFMNREAFSITAVITTLVLLGGALYEIAMGQYSGTFVMLLGFQSVVFVVVLFFIRKRS